MPPEVSDTEAIDARKIMYALAQTLDQECTARYPKMIVHAMDYGLRTLASRPGQTTAERMIDGAIEYFRRMFGGYAPPEADAKIFVEGMALIRQKTLERLEPRVPTRLERVLRFMGIIH